jgi:hypothetical protein
MRPGVPIICTTANKTALEVVAGAIETSQS